MFSHLGARLLAARANVPFPHFAAALPSRPRSRLRAGAAFGASFEPSRKGAAYVMLAPCAHLLVLCLFSSSSQVVCYQEGAESARCYPARGNEAACA